MGYAIEMYFDDEADRAIRTIWQQLIEAGIFCFPSIVNARPHVSLAVFEQVDPALLAPLIERYVATFAPLSLQFSSVGSFPGSEGVVFLAPVVSQTLLTRHAELHAQLSQIEGVQRDYYLPGRWVPHCTLAINLPPAQIPHAFEVVRECDWPKTAQITEIGLDEFRGIVTHFSYAVGG